MGDGARLVAGITFRDLLRRPGGWVATLLTAAMFALLVGALGLSNQRVQDRAEDRSFKIAIGGDLDGASRTIEAMRTPRLTFIPSKDVSADVTGSRASAGIVFPAATDRLLDEGKSVDVEMYQRGSASVSVEAFNSLGVRLQEVELQRLAAAGGQPAAIGAAADVVINDLPRDEHLNRVELARQLAPIAALLCIGIVTSVASILGSARERRSMEPLLVLPIERRAIARGIAFGAFPLAALQILAAVLLLVLTAAIPSSEAHQPLSNLVPMLVAGSASALVLALVATGFGSLAGALGTGSDDAVSLGDLVSVLFVVVGVIVFAVPTIGDTLWFDAIPILGQVLLIRDTVSGVFDPLAIVLACTSAVVTFWLLVRVAGDRLSDDRRLARAIR